MSATAKLSLFLAVLLLLTWTTTLPTGTSAAATSTTFKVQESYETTTGPSSTSKTDEDDWRDNTLIYQILPKSFQDSNGDGLGDLQGIISRLDYLVDLGVDTIRLSFIYSSSQVGLGHHILNHTDIDPIYGDFTDFYELINKAHDKDLKVILDIIPNHSSDQHKWFLASVNDRSPYNDYYIWADGKIKNNKIVPPNNLKSTYDDADGSAWTWNMKKRQWYYHKFHYTEPDLNLRNEDVVEEILNIFDFWLEKGVDGFCICGISYLSEDKYLLDKLLEENLRQRVSNYVYDDDDDNDDDDDDDDDDGFSMNLLDKASLLNEFREHIDKWVEANNNNKSILLIGEINESDDKISSYYGTDPTFSLINLSLVTQLNNVSNARDIKNLINQSLTYLPNGATTNWMLSNQDYSRAASRLNPDLLDGLYMITLLLPGQASTYYGEEIGMLDGNISVIYTINTNTSKQKGRKYFTSIRDNVRTPMQWDNTTSAGFSTNKYTFLPVNSNYKRINVNAQLRDADSNLEAYKKLAILRKNPIFTDGDYELEAINNDKIFILKRSLGNDTCIAIINFGSSKETVNLTALYPNLEEDLQVMVDSSNANVEKENDEDGDDDIENDAFVLAANAAAVLCDKDDFKEFPFETTTDDDTQTDDDDNDNDSADNDNDNADNHNDSADKDNDDKDNDDKDNDDKVDDDKSKDSDKNDDDEKDDDEKKTTTSLSSEHDSNTELSTGSSTNTRQALLFIILIHLILVLFL